MNSLRECRYILVLIVILNDFLHCNTLTLIYDVLFSVRLYYIPFKEVKILWGIGSDNTNTHIKLMKFRRFYCLSIVEKLWKYVNFINFILAIVWAQAVPKKPNSNTTDTMQMKRLAGKDWKNRFSHQMHAVESYVF